jgi:hypothetical protein
VTSKVVKRLRRRNHLSRFRYSSVAVSSDFNSRASMISRRRSQWGSRKPSLAARGTSAANVAGGKRKCTAISESLGCDRFTFVIFCAPLGFLVLIMRASFARKTIIFNRLICDYFSACRQFALLDNWR